MSQSPDRCCLHVSEACYNMNKSFVSVSVCVQCFIQDLTRKKHKRKTVIWWNWNLYFSDPWKSSRDALEGPNPLVGNLFHCHFSAPLLLWADRKWCHDLWTYLYSYHGNIYVSMLKNRVASGDRRYRLVIEEINYWYLELKNICSVNIYNQWWNVTK